jgi:hypothetical protein
MIERRVVPKIATSGATKGAINIPSGPVWVTPYLSTLV